MDGGPLPGTSARGKRLGDLITEIRTGFVYTEFKPDKDRRPGRGGGAGASGRTGGVRTMKEFWKKWKRAILFTVGGALAGLAYYAWVGCSTGSCAITANPLNTMVYTGLIGLLLSGSLGGCCGGSCSRKPPE